MRIIKNLIGRLKGYSECEHCHDTWNWKKSKTIYFTKNNESGIFALCNECFSKLPADIVFNYYLYLFIKYHRPILNTSAKMRKAIDIMKINIYKEKK